MKARTGITTGCCAAAAAKAAATVLCGGPAPESVTVSLPSGEEKTIAILYAHRIDESRATAAVRKDAGDDPDVTDQREIAVTIGPSRGGQTEFRAGEGVGTVTKPGLQIPPGEPAINPVPRQMIAQALRDVTPQALCVEVAIPGGRELAAKTFNPRLGIEGGLSILGTTGIVRPYCRSAIRESLRCGLDVSAACGVTAPVLVPGNIGAKAVRLLVSLQDDQVIQVGNEWGFVLDIIGNYPFRAILAAGHPGKMAKLALGEWDTHSARSGNAAQWLGTLAAEVLGATPPSTSDCAGEPARPVDAGATAEGFFAALAPADRKRLADALARRVRQAIAERVGKIPVAVLLVTMAGAELGRDGDFSPWR